MEKKTVLTISETNALTTRHVIAAHPGWFVVGMVEGAPQSEPIESRTWRLSVIAWIVTIMPDVPFDKRWPTFEGVAEPVCLETKPLGWALLAPDGSVANPEVEIFENLQAFVKSRDDKNDAVQ